MIDIISKKAYNYILISFFFPVFFTRSGIYRIITEGPNNSSNGLVLPFTVILGVWSVFKILKENLNNNTLTLDRDNKILIYILIFYYTIFMYTFFGLILYNDMTSLILTLQFFSGSMGIVIGIYFVHYRKMTAENIYYGISIIFLIAIFSNLILLITRVGLVNIFSRNTVAATHLGGIYHMYIYYAFIIATVFNFALPFWEKNNKAYIFIYLVVTIYILSLQVKGAIISYFIGIISYYLFFRENNSWMKRFGFISTAITLFLILPKDFIIGRFGMKDTSLISGRENVWKEYLQIIKSDPLHIIRGSFSQSTTIKGNVGSLSTGGFHSFHNQYLDILDSFGLIIFIFFIFLIIFMLYRMNTNIKYINTTKTKTFKYWTFLVLVHLLIDLNTNVPLKVTNPSIIHLFYWSTLFLLIKKQTNKTDCKDNTSNKES